MHVHYDLCVFSGRANSMLILLIILINLRFHIGGTRYLAIISIKHTKALDNLQFNNYL